MYTLLLSLLFLSFPLPPISFNSLSSWSAPENSAGDSIKGYNVYMRKGFEEFALMPPPMSIACCNIPNVKNGLLKKLDYGGQVENPSADCNSEGGIITSCFHLYMLGFGHY